MKTTTLKITGTRVYTLSTRPSRIVWTPLPSPPGQVALQGRLLPWWRWWPKLIAWRLFRRRERVKIRFDNEVMTPSRTDPTAFDPPGAPTHRAR